MLSFNEISTLISESCEGLTYQVKALVQELTKDLDVKKGIAEITSLQRLARSMWVERVQGRKVEVITKETIRSYLRTMHKCSKGLIQVITTKDKKIHVFFPLIAEAYKNFAAQQKEYAQEGDSCLGQSPEQARAFEGCEQEVAATQTVESSALSPLYINKIKYKKNINISVPLGFTPTSETIDAALTKGLISVLDQSEVQRFITWNVTNDTKHSPSKWQSLFLRWLENTHRYNEEKAKTIRKPNHARKYVNGAHKPKFNSLLEENAYYRETEPEPATPHIEAKTICFDELFITP